MEKAAKLVTHISTLIIKPLVLVLVLFSIYLVYRELTDEIVMVQPFEVAQELNKWGYTSRTVTHRFVDKLELIARTKTTAKRAAIKSIFFIFTPPHFLCYILSTNCFLFNVYFHYIGRMAAQFCSQEK